MVNRHMLVVWAYAVEIILSTAALLLAAVAFGVGGIVAFTQAAASDFAMYFGVTMFAASLALFWTFYSKADSDFIKWLQERGAFQTYLRAFHASIAIYLLMLLMLMAAKHTGNTAVTVLAAWAGVLGIVNAYSLVKNVSDLMRLNVLFNQKNNNS